jgi:hypothetical protein
MTPEKLDEAKEFKRNSGIMAIVLWVFVGFLAYMADPKTIEVASFVGIGAIALTYIYFRMGSLIKEYEKIINGK